MKYPLLKALVILVVVGLCRVASAGEIHQGRGSTKFAAMKQANIAAREAAQRKETGWRPAKLHETRQNPDGSWRARAESANHEGSLARGGYLMPNDPLPSFDDEPVQDQTPNPTPSPFLTQSPTRFTTEYDSEPESEPADSAIVGLWQRGMWKVELRPNGIVHNPPNNPGESGAYGTWKKIGSEVHVFYRDRLNYVLTPAGDEEMSSKRMHDGELRPSGSWRRVGGVPTSTSGSPPDPVGADRRSSKHNYLLFAAIFERSGDRSQAKIVEDKVEEREGSEAAIEADFSKLVQSRYQTSFNTWVIHVIPQTTYAVIYSYTMDGGRTKGIAVAEGESREQAEGNMQSQTRRFNRSNVEVVRWWPNPR